MNINHKENKSIQTRRSGSYYEFICN